MGDELAYVIVQWDASFQVSDHLGFARLLSSTVLIIHVFKSLTVYLK